MNGARTSWTLRGYAWVVYAFLYLPILALVVVSFNAGRSQAVWAGFSWKWYAVALRNERVLDCVKSSLVVAGVTAAVATIIGTLAGLALAKRFPGRGATGGLVLLPIVIPEIVLGVSLLTFFVPVMGWQPSPWTLMIAHVVFSLSYVAIVVRARLAGFDRTLEEAARDLGAGPLGVFWRVKFPLILPGVVAGALLAFTVSVDDYVITSLVYPPGWQTLPLYIYSEVKRGVTPEVNAVSTMLLGGTVVVILVAQWLATPRYSTKGRTV